MRAGPTLLQEMIGEKGFEQGREFVGPFHWLSPKIRSSRSLAWASNSGDADKYQYVHATLV